MPLDLPDWATTVYQLDQALTGSPISYVNGTTAVTFTVPTGVHLLSITLPTQGNVGQLTVTGVTTGARYLAIDPQLENFQTTYYVFIPYLVDAQVTVTITATGTGSAYVNGVSAPIAVAALPQNAAAWQAPTYPANPISFDNPGPGNNFVILNPPGAGLQLWLHSMWWVWTVASTTTIGDFQDTAGLVIGWDSPITAGQPRFMDHKGAKLNNNAGFEFHQTAGAAAGTTHCFGSITYSVY